MNRARSALVVFLALVLSLILVPIATAEAARAEARPSQLATEEVSPSQAALNKVASCMSGNSETNVLFVIDESSSLGGANEAGSDPASKRSDGLNIAIDGLASLQASTKTKRINIAADTFSDTYKPKVLWGPADAAHIQELKRFATVDVPNLNGGQGTDYGLAMTEAIKSLDVRGSGACRVIFWFTDGALYVDGGSDASKLVAYQDICRSGGVSDALRGSQTYLVALALFDSAASEVTDQDRSRLQAIAEGKSPAGDICGTSPIPEGQARGAYLPVANADRLSQVFADAIARIANFQPAGDPVGCEGPQCPDGTVTFDVDPGVESVRVLAFGTEGTPAYTVTPPGGSPQQVQPGLGRIGSAPSQVTASSGTTNVTTTVDLDVTDPANLGTWRFQVTQGRADVRPWLKSGTALALGDPNQTLRADSATEVPVRLVRADGSGVDPAIYNLQGPTAQASAGGPVTVASRGADGWVLTVPPVETPTLPTSRLLGVTLGLTSKPNGVRLETLEQSFDLTTTLAPSYPLVPSKELTFPRADKVGPVTASLIVKGSSAGPSQVCVGAMSLKGPLGPLPLAPVPGTLDAANCLALDKDQQRDIAFATDVTEMADGQATGAVSLELQGSQPSDPVVTMQVPATMALERPPKPWWAFLLLVLLMLLAAAVPIIIVGFLGKRVLAKFTSGDLRTINVPVQLQKNADGDWSATITGRGDLAVSASNVTWQQVPADQRRVALTGAPIVFDANFEFIRTRSLGPIRRFPVLSVRASATATFTGAGDYVMASNRNPFSFDGRKAPASLRLDECWFLIAPSAAAATIEETGTVQAELVAIGKGEEFPDPDVHKRVLPLIVTRMVDAMRRTAGPRPGSSTQQDPAWSPDQPSPVTTPSPVGSAPTSDQVAPDPDDPW